MTECVLVSMQLCPGQGDVLRPGMRAFLQSAGHVVLCPLIGNSRSQRETFTKTNQGRLVVLLEQSPLDRDTQSLKEARLQQDLEDREHHRAYLRQGLSTLLSDANILLQNKLQQRVVSQMVNLAECMKGAACKRRKQANALADLAIAQEHTAHQKRQQAQNPGDFSLTAGSYKITGDRSCCASTVSDSRGGNDGDGTVCSQGGSSASANACVSFLYTDKPYMHTQCAQLCTSVSYSSAATLVQSDSVTKCSRSKTCLLACIVMNSLFCHTLDSAVLFKNLPCTCTSKEIRLNKKHLVTYLVLVQQ